jgi:putative exporter of polyketide antibiotics
MPSPAASRSSKAKTINCYSLVGLFVNEEVVGQIGAWVLSNLTEICFAVVIVMQRFAQP